MLTRLSRLLALFALALAAWGDVTGRWEGQMPTQSGVVRVTLSLQADASQLTGTLTSPNGTLPIAEGTVSGAGDQFSFSTGTGSARVAFRGVLSAGEVRMTRTPATGSPSEFILRRAP